MISLCASDPWPFDSFHQSQHAFRVALCDSFNTPDALSRLIDLVSRTNVYLARGRTAVNIGVVHTIAAWVTKMVRMFGLAEGSAVNGGPGSIGWGTVTKEGEDSDVSQPFQYPCTPLIAMTLFSARLF